MKYLLAVSGGVDSMVLLERFSRSGEDLAVAHFDHGIREESARDAEFVRQKCLELGVKCFIGKGNLGVRASEEKARKARYEFLTELATSRDRHPSDGICIATAHHKDDLLETIVMNLIRGTGWRGLAPMKSGVERPLIGMWKTEVVAEAIEKDLEWVEDDTNYSSRYFRNRVREVLYRADGATKRKILELYEKQKKLRLKIDEILVRELPCSRRTKAVGSAWVDESRRTMQPRESTRSSTTKHEDSPEKAGYKPTSLFRCSARKDLAARVCHIDRKWLMDMDRRVAKEIFNHIMAGKLTGVQLGRVVEFVRTAKPAKQMIFKEVEVSVTKNTVAVSCLMPDKKQLL